MRSETGSGFAPSVVNRSARQREALSAGAIMRAIASPAMDAAAQAGRASRPAAEAIMVAC